MEKTNQILKKLLKWQKTIGPITKTAENDFFHSSYFDINALLDKLIPLITEDNVLLLQPIVFEEGKNVLYTKLIDVDDFSSVEASMALPDNIDPQKNGSAITYFRRYCLQSLLGLRAEDDDGNSASGNAVRKPSVGGEKTCDICGKPHTGPYKTCYSCYTKKK